MTPAPTQRQLDCLSRMAAGDKDEKAARNVGLSLRTFRREVEQLMILVGAKTRFQLGSEAQRRGWIPKDGGL